MRRRRILKVGALCSFLALAAAAPVWAARKASGRSPLVFEANRGQTAPEVDFLARGPGYNIFLAGGRAVLSLGAPGGAGAVLRLELKGASSRRGVGRTPLPGKVNYFVGSDPGRWRTGLDTYARVTYSDVYPGVDVVYYGTQEGRLEHDFIVQPGVDPAIIGLRFQGADSMEVDAQGDLVLGTAAGAVQFRRPLIYQETPAGRREVAGGYERRGRKTFGFNVAPYDRSQPLIIDPVLVYSSYIDATNASGLGVGIAVHPSGAAYVLSLTSSPAFPVTAGAFDASANGAFDVVISKFDPTGAGLDYSTYLGGRRGDIALTIGVDATGAAYVAGNTSSSDFPTTPGAYDTTMNTSTTYFVTKLDPSGAALVYSTFLGGSVLESSLGLGFLSDLAVDSSGAAYVAGQTAFTDFPTTPGAFDTTYNGSYDGFVTKLDPSGATLLYSTYLGGEGSENLLAIRVDGSGAAYIAGTTTALDFPVTAGAFDTVHEPPPAGSSSDEAFVTKLNPAGTGLVFSTYLGGSKSDVAFDITFDGSGACYVTGSTTSADFPTTAGAFDTSFNGGTIYGDGFVTKLNSTGSALVYSTFLGGSDEDDMNRLVVDPSGAAYIVGQTRSSGFPVTADALDATLSGFNDACVSKLDPSGTSLLYSTYLGGSQQDGASDIAIDSSRAVYITGETGSADFPTTPGSFDTVLDGSDIPFVVKLCIGCDQRPPCLQCGPDEGGRILMCHRPPGNPEYQRTLHLPASVLEAHCAHGDLCGACEDDE